MEQKYLKQAETTQNYPLSSLFHPKLPTIFQNAEKTPKINIPKGTISPVLTVRPNLDPKLKSASSSTKTSAMKN